MSFRELSHLKGLLAKVSVENEGIAGDGAYIDEITDAHSGALNSALTPGGMLHITGHKIKVEGEEPENGLWLVNQADQGRTKVSENLAVNRASELIAQLPALAPGDYRLEIVTRYAGGTPLKENRTIQAEPVLTVSP